MNASQLDPHPQAVSLDRLSGATLAVYLNGRAAYHAGGANPYPASAHLEITSYDPTTFSVTGTVNFLNGAPAAPVQGTVTQGGSFGAPTITLAATGATDPFEFSGLLHLPANPTGDGDPRYHLFITGQYFFSVRFQGGPPSRGGPVPFCAFPFTQL